MELLRALLAPLQGGSCVESSWLLKTGGGRNHFLDKVLEIHKDDFLLKIFDVPKGTVDPNHEF